MVRALSKYAITYYAQAYQISIVIVFVIVVLKVQFVSLIPKSARGIKPISYRGVLLNTLLHVIV
jgi:hypothetical protein